MVCHCKPPPGGRLGCGEECLNRLLNIECLHGTCPAGDLCSNQQVWFLVCKQKRYIHSQVSYIFLNLLAHILQFQKRKYVKFERFQSGKKGYGLRLLEDVREGQFLIEYVGEVCFWWWFKFGRMLSVVDGLLLAYSFFRICAFQKTYVYCELANRWNYHMDHLFFVTGAWYAILWGSSEGLCFYGSETFLFYDSEWEWGKYLFFLISQLLLSSSLIEMVSGFAV